jgi:hypothetical protein
VAVIGPLVSARKTADLARLAASCRQLRLFIAELPFYKHSKTFRHSLKNIEGINILSNEHCSIKEYNNDLHVFGYDHIAIHNYSYLWKFGYHIRAIKARTYTHIKCHEKIEITRENDTIGFYICVNGPIPSWLNKYPINYVNEALKYYTFVV